MSTYDVIAVFGTQLKPNGRFPEFVYQELGVAVDLLQRHPKAMLAVCGSHAMDAGLRGLPPECDVAESYLNEKLAGQGKKILKEGRSTTIPENWLYLRLSLERLGISSPRILQLTIKPLLPRVRFLGERIFGKKGQLSFKALPWPAKDFPQEPRLLGDAMCTLKTMAPGDMSFLLDDQGESRWDELRKAHHACPYYGGLHSAS